MRNALYFIAFILIGGWAIGYFGYAQGGLIHLILVMGVVVLATRLMQERKSFEIHPINIYLCPYTFIPVFS